jgi:hypothetical protein
MMWLLLLCRHCAYSSQRIMIVVVGAAAFAYLHTAVHGLLAS